LGLAVHADLTRWLCSRLVQACQIADAIWRYDIKALLSMVRLISKLKLGEKETKKGLLDYD